MRPKVNARHKCRVGRVFCYSTTSSNRAGRVSSSTCKIFARSSMGSPFSLRYRAANRSASCWRARRAAFTDSLGLRKRKPIARVSSLTSQLTVDAPELVSPGRRTPITRPDACIFVLLKSSIVSQFLRYHSRYLNSMQSAIHISMDFGTPIRLLALELERSMRMRLQPLA